MRGITSIFNKKASRIRWSYEVDVFRIFPNGR